MESSIYGGYHRGAWHGGGGGNCRDHNSDRVGVTHVIWANIYNKVSSVDAKQRKIMIIKKKTSFAKQLDDNVGTHYLTSMIWFEYCGMIWSSVGINPFPK